MKKGLLSVGFAVLITGLEGCAYLHKQPNADLKKTNTAVTLAPYSGFKAKVAVADFEIKAAKASSELGYGLRQMLVTALVNSNRIYVTNPQLPSSQDADLIIKAIVSEFEPQSSGGRGGLGGGGGVDSGVLGALLGVSLNKVHILLEIQIIDTTTSEVLGSTKLQGQATDISGGLIEAHQAGLVLESTLSSYANTPMEKAIKGCIVEAGRYIAQTIPKEYYKYQ